MTRTITITDPMQVEIGDKAYFKGCDFGFTVLDVNKYAHDFIIKVNIPISKTGFWSESSLFDHATREVDEPKWPDPHDITLHVYLGADGRRYIYNPTDKDDTEQWVAEGYFASHSREDMEAYYHDALPLTELNLVLKENES